MNMNININILKDGIGSQIFDAWYAYRQSLSNDGKLPFNVTFNRKQSGDFNILFDYMPSMPAEPGYDLVFYCNGGEPLTVATEVIFQEVDGIKTYLIANSYLPPSHQAIDKVIWFPHNIMTCRDLWTRHFYPQFFSNFESQKAVRTPTVFVIGGANREHRQYFNELLEAQEISVITHPKAQTPMEELPYAWWESESDEKFRCFLKDRFQSSGQYQTSAAEFSMGFEVGINNKFGSAPLGYFILPEYFENSVVVFPESTWQNNELCITEKALKCFYSRALPMPIGGANINQMYNEIGFSTAWNLLPGELKQFDSNFDHVTRYEQAIDAISWLSKNPEVLDGPEFKQLTDQNFVSFLTCSADIIAIKKFDSIISAAAGV